MERIYTRRQENYGLGAIQLVFWVILPLSEISASSCRIFTSDKEICTTQSLKINPHHRKRKKLCTSNAKVMKKICSCVGESSIVLIRRYKTVKTQKDSISQFLEVLFFLFWNWLEERSDFYFSFFLLSPVTVI